MGVWTPERNHDAPDPQGGCGAAAMMSTAAWWVEHQLHASRGCCCHHYRRDTHNCFVMVVTSLRCELCRRCWSLATLFSLAEPHSPPSLPDRLRLWAAHAQQPPSRSSFTSPALPVPLLRRLCSLQAAPCSAPWYPNCRAMELLTGGRMVPSEHPVATE